MLRRLTRAISDFLREQVKGYLSALAPLLRPRSTLGEYVQGSAKEAFSGSEKAFQDLQSIYEQVADSKPFKLPKELKPPLYMVSSTLEMTPVEYTYAAKTERQNKNVLVHLPVEVGTLLFRFFAQAAGTTPRRSKSRRRKSREIRPTLRGAARRRLEAGYSQPDSRGASLSHQFRSLAGVWRTADNLHLFFRFHPPPVRRRDH